MNGLDALPPRSLFTDEFLGLCACLRPNDFFYRGAVSCLHWKTDQLKEWFHDVEEEEESTEETPKVGRMRIEKARLMLECFRQIRKSSWLELIEKHSSWNIVNEFIRRWIGIKYLTWTSFGPDFVFYSSQVLEYIQLSNKADGIAQRGYDLLQTYLEHAPDHMVDYQLAGWATDYRAIEIVLEATPKECLTILLSRLHDQIREKFMKKIEINYGKYGKHRP